MKHFLLALAVFAAAVSASAQTPADSAADVEPVASLSLDRMTAGGSGIEVLQRRLDEQLENQRRLEGQLREAQNRNDTAAVEMIEARLASARAIAQSYASSLEMMRKTQERTRAANEMRQLRQEQLSRMADGLRTPGIERTAVPAEAAASPVPAPAPAAPVAPVAPTAKAAASPISAPAASANTVMQEAERLYKVGDYEKAIPLYRHLVENDAPNAVSLPAQRRLADCYGKTGRPLEELNIRSNYLARAERKKNPGNDLIAAQYTYLKTLRTLRAQALRDATLAYDEARRGEAKPAEEGKDPVEEAVAALKEANDGVRGMLDEYAKLIRRLTDTKQRAKYEANAKQKEINDQILQSALFDRAYCLSALNQPEAQISKYKQLAIKDLEKLLGLFPKTQGAPIILLQLGTLYSTIRTEDEAESSENAKKASEYFNRLSTDYPDSEQAKFLVKRGYRPAAPAKSAAAPAAASAGAAASPAPSPAASAPKKPKSAADRMSVVAEGMGATVEEARKDAIRNAVSKAVGEMVDAETTVVDDELVEDKILTYSNGYVDTMEVLSAATNETGLVALRIRADVQRTKLQAKVTEVMKTEADADGDSLFAEMLSRQDSIEDAEKMLVKILSSYREDLLLEAGAVLREDGKPAVELDPHSGTVTVKVRLAVNEKAAKAWMEDVCPRLAKMSDRKEILHGALTSDQKKCLENSTYKYKNNLDQCDLALAVGTTIFYFKEDYRPALQRGLEAVPESQSVRIALVDRNGDSIASMIVDTTEFEDSSPLSRPYPSWFWFQSPSTTDVVFEGLTLADLRAVAKIVCVVGPWEKLRPGDAERMLAYRKAHPNRTVTLADGVSFELAPLSPRLLMGTTEVTQAVWESIMGNNPCRSNQGPDRPVEEVSWNDCQAFLERLNEHPAAKETGLVFRLPRVEEWTEACLAGAQGGFCRLADGTEITLKTIGRVAWFHGPYIDPRTGPPRSDGVGRREPNAFGLYDMLGNVIEFTSSRFTSSVGGPSGRIGCGGSYWDYPTEISKEAERNPGPRCVFEILNRRDSETSGSVGLRLCASEKAN